LKLQYLVIGVEKITNIEQVLHDSTYDWVLSGTTDASDDSKSLVTVYDKK